MNAVSVSKISRVLINLGIGWLLAGCASMRNVIVDVDFDAQIQMRDNTGQYQLVAPSEVTKERHPQAASPFPHVHYNGKLFEWRISAGKHSLGYFFRGNLNEPLCFRFDEATMTSNFQTKEVPMRLRATRHGPIGGDLQAKLNAPNESPSPAPSVCSFSDKGATYLFRPDLSELFPSGQLFNINQTGDSLSYSERGAGNWLRIRFPIESGGKREELEVTLTAKDSKARYSYY